MPIPLTAIDAMAHSVYACVCASLTDAATKVAGHPGCPPCGGVVPGQIAWDACTGCAGSGDCSGQLSVAARRIYPSDPFPRLFAGVRGTKTCGAFHVMAVELIIGLSRCVPVSDDQGRPPSPASLAAAAEILHIDMTAVSNALECCLPGLDDRPRGLQYVVGESRVIGPSGGCVGFEQSVTVGLNTCACPDDGSSNPVEGP